MSDVNTLISTRIGPNNAVEGTYSLAVGNNNTVPSEVVDILTPNSTILSNFCISSGDGNTVGGFSSTCYAGSGNQVTGFNMSGMGENNQAKGAQSSVLGANNFSIGFQNVAEGNSTANGKVVDDLIDLPRAGIHILGDGGLARAGIVSQNFTDDTDNYSLQLAGGPFQGLNTQDPKTAYGTGISAIIKTRVRGLHPEGEMITHRFTADGSAYSEYFKWGNPPSRQKAHKRIGLFVCLGDSEKTADKIFPAEITCCVIGVTTAKPAVTGDSDELGWDSMVKKGECGDSYKKMSYKDSIVGFCQRMIPSEKHEIMRIHNSQANLPEEEYRDKMMTQIKSSNRLSSSTKKEMTKLNPIPIMEMKDGIDHTSTHQPRSLDPAWVPVALLGKVIVRDDGTCQPGKTCRVGKYGYATHSHKRHHGWHVLRRISHCSVEILFK